MREYKLNRMETVRLMGPWSDQYWQEIREAKQQGKMVAWSTGGPLEMIIARAMGIEPCYYAGYVSYLAGRGGAAALLDAAEVAGYLRDSCSYLRIHLGLVYKYLKGDQ